MTPVKGYACLVDGVEEERYALLDDAGTWLRDNMHRVNTPGSGDSHILIASLFDDGWRTAVGYGRVTLEIRQRLERDYGLQVG